MARTIVHLVHGTWPYGPLAQHLRRLQRPERTWFHPASSFSRALAGALPPDVDVRPFLWSGANSYLARHEAAAALAHRMHALDAEPDPPRQIIVAHSHGGNVALLAAMHPWSPAIAGIATLGTPFLAVERTVRDANEQRLLIALQLFSLLLAGVVGMVSLFVVFGHADALSYANSGWSSTWALIRAHPAFYALMLGVLYGMGTIVQQTLALRRILERVPEGLDEPRAPLLVLRAPRDEAGLVLAAAQLAHLLLGVVWRPLRALVRWIAPSVRYEWFLPLLFLPLGWAGATVAVLARMLRFDEPWDTAWRHVYPAAAPAAWPIWQRLPYEIVQPVAEAGAPVALVALTLGLVVGLLLLAAGLLLTPFGWELVVMGLVLDVTAEATPPRGTYTVEMLAPLPSGLRHFVHELPQARRSLAAWIAQLPQPAGPEARPWRVRGAGS